MFVRQADLELVMAAKKILRHQRVTDVDGESILRSQLGVRVGRSGGQSRSQVQPARRQREAVLVGLTGRRVVGPPAGVSANDVEDGVTADVLKLSAVDRCRIRVILGRLEGPQLARTVLPDELVATLPHIIDTIVLRQLIRVLLRYLPDAGLGVGDRLIASEVGAIRSGIRHEPGNSGVLLLCAVAIVEPQLVT